MEFLVTEDNKEATNGDAPENNPLCTTVYVGNLASEVRMPSSMYRWLFHNSLPASSKI